MMYPCKQCGQAKGNKAWRYHHDDETGLVVATCKQCGYQVKFPGKRKKKLDAGVEIGGKAHVEFRTINGRVCRKEPDGNFYPVEFRPAKGGGIKLTAIR